MKEGDIIEKRKEELKKKISSFLKDRYNLYFIGIFIFAIFIRLYYFALTKNQPLWWDEASYGSIAKNLVSHQFENVPIIINESVIRPFFLPFLWSILLRLDFSEPMIRFTLVLLPSILSVFFVYLSAKELYNKRIAIISSFIFAGLWIHLFYSVRLLTGITALFFSLVSIYLFIRSYKNDFKFNLFFFSIFFLSLAFLMRYPFALVGFVYLFFILLTGRVKFFTKKSFLTGGFFGMFPVFIFLVYNFIKKGSFFPAVGTYSSGIAEIRGFAFYTFGFVPHILQKTFLILFFIGLFLVVFELILGYGIIRKTKRLESNLLILILLTSVFIFFVFITKFSEDRYLFICMLSFLCLIALGVDYIYKLLVKHNKLLAISIIFFILLFGAYQHLKFGDAMIKSKKSSFTQMRDAFLWLKDNSNKGDKIMVANYAELYSLYYAERVPYSTPADIDSFKKEIEEFKPDFFVMHFFNKHYEYLYQYIQSQPRELKIENIWFFNQQNPAVIIYSINTSTS